MFAKLKRFLGTALFNNPPSAPGFDVGNEGPMALLLILVVVVVVIVGLALHDCGVVADG